MAKSLFFYDLETSGINPRDSRIMQFGGQRTSLDLMTIGEPQDILVKLSEDILPDPWAILVTGITPQKTLADGVTEAEFLKTFHENVVTPDTIFVGYNSIRFDDEFMRYLHYRNFYDAYEWQWRDGRAKWDLLDVVRMTRALRPQGINWPIQDGKSTNQLGLLTSANNIAHVGAHDALSDVKALIELAKLIYKHQLKLFNFLLDIMTDKNKIAKFISQNDMFVYTSGKYPSESEKTTIVAYLDDHPRRQGAIIYDLRYDPSKYVDLSVDELAQMWQPVDRDQPRLPVKTLQFNRCPAIAPVSVVDKDSEQRIKLSVSEAKVNFEKLQKIKSEFSKKIIQALKILDQAQDLKYSSLSQSVDAMLYDNFFNENDKRGMVQLRSTEPAKLNTSEFEFSDKRLTQLLPLYKARNYPLSLADEERQAWEEHKASYMLSGKEASRMAKYFKQLEEMSQNPKLNKNARFLLEELKLYGESIIPSQDF